MPDAPTLTGADELVGEVAAVVFANPDTGFGVIVLAGPGDRRAAGPLAGLVPGQAVRLVGRWTEHERHGATFATDYFALARPQSVEGLAAFLASDAFPGVGETLATRIVTRFGLDVGSVIESASERLAEVKGVSPKLAAEVAKAWATAGALALLVEELGAVGIPVAVARAAASTLGEDPAAALAEDPYALLGVRGAQWRHAEALARAAGLTAHDPRRQAAAAVAAQLELTRREGHVAVDADTLAGRAARLLAGTLADGMAALEAAVHAGRLVRDDALDATGWHYLPTDLALERELAEDIARLASAQSRVRAVDTEHVDAGLTEEQRAAVAAALASPVSVLTGGPGTGKTHTVRALLAACAAQDLRVALCAPTGRAARRLEELTGHAATTVHRLLEARGAPGAGFVFGVGADNRLPHDVVIADEWSMADLRLAAALTAGVGDGAHLVLVGDADQLPSVGPGAVLRDLCDPRAGGLITASRLTQVHRQAAASRIVTLAHELRSGALAPPDPPRAHADGDVWFLPERTDRIAARVAAIVADRAPDYFGLDPSHVQVLAPMYRGLAGVDALNEALKARLNPARGRRAVGGFHEGDRVVATRNDADLDLANGDIGEVAAADATAGSLEVAFPQGMVTVGADRIRDLAPAWCLTVHKSQGGEWPVVVLVLDAAHRRMLTRELTYTAVTRAAQSLLLIGDVTLVASAARHTDGGAALRRTGLAARLASLGEAARDEVHDAVRTAPARRDLKKPLAQDDDDESTY